MSEINLKRFVDINIQSNVVKSVIGTRDVCILFTPEGTEGTSTLVSSFTESKETFPVETFPLTLGYLTVFFNNGGIKCLVIEGMAYSDLTKEDITNLDNEYIIIACACSDASVNACYSKMKTLISSLNSDTAIYGINEKILLARTVVDGNTIPTFNDLDDADIKNFGVKYSDVVGAEMTIAAYLTQVNVYKQNTVYDYTFTKENILKESLTDANFEILMNRNMNVDIDLVNSTRNVGGNLKDGAELTNEFVRIVLHQTLTARLTSLLVQKIRNSSGLSQIYSVVAQELEFYKSAGYITTDKVWNSSDLDITYNSNTYTIIEQGTPLTNGYVIKILPISSLTDADKALHKAPPIYVIIATQYGIRQITINGEVI